MIEGMRNAIAYAKGDRTRSVTHHVVIPGDLDVRGVRLKLGLSQAEFSRKFGISAATLRNWEQGLRQPEGPARVLMTIIDREPKVVQRVLGGR